MMRTRLSQRAAIVAAAARAGWFRRADVDVLAYERPIMVDGLPAVESLLVQFVGAGRVGHVTHAVYPLGVEAPAMSRESLGVDEPGRSRISFALGVLSSDQVREEQPK